MRDPRSGLPGVLPEQVHQAVASCPPRQPTPAAGPRREHPRGRRGRQRRGRAGGAKQGRRCGHRRDAGTCGRREQPSRRRRRASRQRRLGPAAGLGLRGTATMGAQRRKRFGTLCRRHDTSCTTRRDQLLRLRALPGWSGRATTVRGTAQPVEVPRLPLQDRGLGHWPGGPRARHSRHRGTHQLEKDPRTRRWHAEQRGGRQLGPRDAQASGARGAAASRRVQQAESPDLGPDPDSRPHELRARRWRQQQR